MVNEEDLNFCASKSINLQKGRMLNVIIIVMDRALKTKELSGKGMVRRAIRSSFFALNFGQLDSPLSPRED